MLLQAALARFIEDGSFARHIRKVGRVYRGRHDMVTTALGRQLSGQLQLIPSAAGLHLAAIARVASAARIDAVVQRASEAGVEIQTLARFALGGPPRSGLVFGYGAIPTARIEEGLRRLAFCFGGT
jgi:GntR family transcriptional regulator/MocR family aminotransferase